MSLIDRAKALFSNLSKRPALSSSVVSHDRIDDSYLDDFRGKASKFEEVYGNAPAVAIGEPPDKCPTCGSDEPQWQVGDAGQLVCEKCATPVAMPEAPYSPWSDLVSDAFRSYFTYSEPRALAQSEVKPSHELNRRIMGRIVNSEEMMDTRPITRMNEFESAFSAMALVTGLHDEIRVGSLKQHAQRAQEMANYEDTLENIERKLQQMRDAINDDPDNVDPDDLQQLLDAHDQTSAKLATVVAQQQASPLGLDVADAVDQAAQQAQEDANTIAGMPGMGGGSAQRVAPDMMFALAERWRQSEVLRRVAELLGRLERDMRFKRANRVVGGFEEVVDVELGDNIGLALPHEMAKLGHPRLKLDFMRRFHEQGIVQYELRGNEPEGKGPTLITKDESYSMQGDRHVWATAVALALVNLAHKEHRDSGVISYSDETDSDDRGVVQAWFFPAREPLDIEAILDCASHFYGGGTDATPAVAHAKRVMEDVPEFRKADLVMITDGEDTFGKDDEELRDAMRARGVRVHGVGIGGTFGYLAKMCDHVIHVADLTLAEGVNEATDHLATAIS